MAGIERIQINSAWHDWRTLMAQELAPAADNLYRQIFAEIGLELLPESSMIECTKEEAISRYDWQEGIDVLLHFKRGDKATLQEKFLTYRDSTITFEERKTSGAPGAWYYCTAQYYFTGYAREYLEPWKSNQPARRRTNPTLSFQDWILVDLPALHRADAQGQCRWSFRENARDGRRASFRYLYFFQVPERAVVSRAWI